MAWYLPVAALALSAAGTGVSVAANESAKSAAKKKQSAELNRQKVFQQRASQEFANSLSKSTPEKAATDLKSAKDERMAAYETAQRVNIGAPAPVASNAGSPAMAQTNPTANEAAMSRQTGTAWARLLNDAAARGNSYADWGLKQNIKDTRVNQRMGLLGTDSRRSAELLPWEIENASHSADGMKYTGQGLTTLGSVLGTASAVGAFGTTGGIDSAAVPGAEVYSANATMPAYDRTYDYMNWRQ